MLCHRDESSVTEPQLPSFDWAATPPSLPISQVKKDSIRSDRSTSDHPQLLTGRKSVSLPPEEHHVTSKQSSSDGTEQVDVHPIVTIRPDSSSFSSANLQRLAFFSGGLDVSKKMWNLHQTACPLSWCYRWCPSLLRTVFGHTAGPRWSFLPPRISAPRPVQSITGLAAAHSEGTAKNTKMSINSVSNQQTGGEQQEAKWR